MSQQAKYAVVICSDGLTDASDVNQLKNKGYFRDASSFLEIQINMGQAKNLEIEAANIAFAGQYAKLAIREWAGKGVSVAAGQISLRKWISPGNNLFIVATY